VFCEKPVALSLEQTIDLFDIADRNNGILIAGFQRRFDASFIEMKARHAEIGNIEVLRIVSRDYASFNLDPSETQVETIKRIKKFVFNSMIHDLDLYAYYTGDSDARVLHSTSSYSASTSLPFSAAAVLESKDGVIGVLELGKLNYY
jgi:myo-inositol 2-dehydrogenase/D-chiro-inositol 1-dehydrogenase